MRIIWSSTCMCWSNSEFVLPNLPRPQRAKALCRNFGSLQRFRQRQKRRIGRLVGELEGAIVMAECALGPAIDEGLHGFRRIHVLIGHEPARLVRADRQQRQPQWAAALARFVEMAAVAVARIADEI